MFLRNTIEAAGLTQFIALLCRWMKTMHLGLKGKEEIADLLFDGDASFGLVRISLGLASNFEDVQNVLRWAENAGPCL